MTQTILQQLGYDRIHTDDTLRLAWKEEDKSVVVDNSRVAVADVGSLSLSAVLSGLDRSAIENIDSLPDAMASLALVSATLTITDNSILKRWIDFQAEAANTDAADMRQQIAQSLPDMIGGIGSADFQKHLATVLQAFLAAPGSITATATPASPLPLVALGALADTAPETLPELLAITIENAAGQGPAPDGGQLTSPPATPPQ